MNRCKIVARGRIKKKLESEDSLKKRNFFPANESKKNWRKFDPLAAGKLFSHEKRVVVKGNFILF